MLEMPQGGYNNTARLGRKGLAQQGQQHPGRQRIAEGI